MGRKWNLDGIEADDQNNMTIGANLTVGGDINGNVNGYVIFPASDPGVVGAWWDNAGTLTKSAG